MKRFCERLSGAKIWDIVWAVMVLILPVTSMPAVVRLVRSDAVAAPSGLVLPFLLIGWALPLILTGKRLSENASPLILFAAAGIFATLFSFFRVIPEYKGQDPFRASFSALLTLFVGLSFYLVSVLRHDDPEKLRSTFRLINISGAAVCFWTLLQAFFWYKDLRYPEWMKNIQFMLSSGSLYRQRFVGFTLEPSWLAHQLNLLYLPFWFAASVTGYSAFFFRLGKLTTERILFLTGAVVLFLTLSRVGLAAFLITAAFCMLVFVRRAAGKFAGRFPERNRKSIMLLSGAGVFLLLVSAGFVILRLLTKLDFRMAGLFDISFIGRSDPVFYLAEKLSLAARFVYWDGGISVFNLHPLLGVGLGHAGFYLPQCLNDYAYRLAEVRRLLYRSQTLLNIKSLWIRIPAETGICGFVFFLAWYLHSLLGNILLIGHQDRIKQTAAWMGCFTCLAFLLEGFSLDTFALPYLWFSIGLAAGARRIRS